MFRNKISNNKGFTLIEFIIVMAIIGILVLMAAPKFMDYIRDAKLTKIKNDVRVVEDVLLTEQAKLLTQDKDIELIIDEDVTKRVGITKDSKELLNRTQVREGSQIDPEFIKKHTNSKLDPEEFYFSKDTEKVFYYYDKAKVEAGEEDDIDDDEWDIDDGRGPGVNGGGGGFEDDPELDLGI